jgi:hypothetical protein
MKRQQLKHKSVRSIRFVLLFGNRLKKNPIRVKNLCLARLNDGAICFPTGSIADDSVVRTRSSPVGMLHLDNINYAKFKNGNPLNSTEAGSEPR